MSDTLMAIALLIVFYLGVLAWTMKHAPYLDDDEGVIDKEEEEENDNK